jgi:hypothetical protein
MFACTDPDALFNVCLRFAEKGARGILLSGGYNSEGYVPFERFLDAIERVKCKTGLFISAHTGLVPKWLAAELGRAGVDLADFDLIGDDETIEFVMGSGKKASDYLRVMRALKNSVHTVVPHICLGLHGGRLKGEFKAIEMAARVGTKMLVFLIFTPTKGTPFEGVKPPTAGEIKRVIDRARQRLPRADLALGCMRPKDRRRGEIELTALRAGVRRIVIPSADLIEHAKRSGFSVRKLNACCAVPLEPFGEPREG